LNSTRQNQSRDRTWAPGHYRLWLSQKASFIESTSGKKAENVAFRAKSDMKEVSWLLS
jgi:hypothetical protein